MSPAAPPQIHPDTFPVALSPLVGRDEDLAAAVCLLREGGARLLTFTGPPGVGKTRLAAQVASAVRADYPEGVFLAHLAAIRDPQRVPAAIARAMGVAAPDRQDGWSALARALRQCSTLLMLANLEQVLAAAPFLADLLAECPHLAMLVTSRAPLRVRGERQFPTAPLAVPPSIAPLPLDALRQVPAVALFLVEAQAARPDFALTAANAEDVAGICRTLGGLPLAIEFAAARLRTLPPDPVRAHLSGPTLLDWLADGRRDRPGRHRTMRRAIAWSYNLLTRPGQAAFQTLALFAGATPPALAAVLADSGGVATLAALDELVDHGLARAEANGASVRFSLPDLLRAYALDRLATSEEEGVLQARFAAYYAALVEQSERAASDLAGAFRPERQNLRVARDWALAHDEPYAARRLAAALATPPAAPDPDQQRARSPHGTPPLSARERQVLALVAAGHSNKRIAQMLYISEGTAKFHVRSLLDKLGADTRAQAVAHAGLRGLL